MWCAPRSQSGCARPTRPAAGSARSRADGDPPRSRRGRRSCSGCWWCPGRSKRRTRPTVLLPRWCPSWTTRARQSSRTAGACALRTAEEIRSPCECGAEVHQTDVGVDGVGEGERGDRGDHAVDIVEADLEKRRNGEQEFGWVRSRAGGKDVEVKRRRTEGSDEVVVERSGRVEAQGIRGPVDRERSDSDDAFGGGRTTEDDQAGVRTDEVEWVERVERCTGPVDIVETTLEEQWNREDILSAVRSRGALIDVEVERGRTGGSSGVVVERQV